MKPNDKASFAITLLTITLSGISMPTSAASNQDLTNQNFENRISAVNKSNNFQNVQINGLSDSLSKTNKKIDDRITAVNETNVTQAKQIKSLSNGVIQNTNSINNISEGINLNNKNINNRIDSINNVNIAQDNRIDGISEGINLNNKNINNRIDSINNVNIAQDNRIDGISEGINLNNKNINNRIDSINNVNVAQDDKIKANKDAIVNNSTNITKLEQEKANLTYVDSENIKQNNMLTDAFNKKYESIDFNFERQDSKINQNSNDIKNLGYKVNELDNSLSAGIASAISLSFMPTNNIPGSHMLTGGTGFYNGESAVAIGFSGTTVNGKYTYKVGGSWATEGGGSGGAGLGYRWK